MELEQQDARIIALNQQIARTDSSIAETERELQYLREGGLVYDFANQRTERSTYTEHLGLIATIRRDFEQLQKLLAEWDSAQTRDATDSPRHRIVLYVDDLDRCEHHKVVEVLQAVHLLLAMPLFVVVVGVDPRWLERSLYQTYLPDLVTRRGSEPPVNKIWDFNPQEYLEKIFHIPYSLPRMQKDGFDQLISDLGAEPLLSEEPSAAPTPPAWTPDPGAAETEPALNQTHDSIEKKDPASERATKSFVKVVKLDTKQERRALTLTQPESGRFEAFVDPGQGEYRAVLLLLAINTGFPRVAGHLLRVLSAGDQTFATLYKARTLPGLLKKLQGEPDGDLTTAQREDLIAVGDLIERLNGEANRAGELPRGLRPYREWAGEVGRYAFHWHLS